MLPGEKGTLDQCYTPFKRGYTAASLTPFGKLDHAAIFLLLEYKQRIVREAVMTREVKPWLDQIDADLRDVMSDVDWDMFQSSSSDVSEFTDVVTSFIATLADTMAPTVKVKSFPNQKLTGAVESILTGNISACLSGQANSAESSAFG